MGDEVSGITVAAFEKFVHSVLARTHPSSVEKFSLRCSYLRSLGMFDYWVSSAISRNVREIEIDLRDHERIPLPASIYRSITLEVLRLRSYFALTLPPDGVCFPRLKTFHLMLQQPTNHLPHNLFSRCPCLQHLSLTVYFTAANPASNLIISSATLKTFVLEVMYCSHSSALNQHTVTIVAPNLEFLDITDDLAVSYAVHQLPSLHKAVYYVMFSEWPPIDRRPPVQLLAGMTKTKCLTLSAGVLHVSINVLSSPLLCLLLASIHYGISFHTDVMSQCVGAHSPAQRCCAFLYSSLPKCCDYYIHAPLHLH